MPRGPKSPQREKDHTTKLTADVSVTAVGSFVWRIMSENANRSEGEKNSLPLSAADQLLGAFSGVRCAACLLTEYSHIHT